MKLRILRNLRDPNSRRRRRCQEILRRTPTNTCRKMHSQPRVYRQGATLKTRKPHIVTKRNTLLAATFAYHLNISNKYIQVQRRLSMRLCGLPD